MKGDAVITAKRLHELVSRYFDIQPLDSSTAAAFRDPFDFIVHETWKRRTKDDEECRHSAQDWYITDVGRGCAECDRARL